MKTEMTWNDYAAEHKQCFTKFAINKIQATRYQPAREVREWVVFLPAPCVIGTVSCRTIEEAREIAAQYGCTIII